MLWESEYVCRLVVSKLIDLVTNSSAGARRLNANIMTDEFRTENDAFLVRHVVGVSKVTTDRHVRVVTRSASPKHVRDS